MKSLVISASLPPFNDSSTLSLVERVHNFQKHGISSVFIGAEMPAGVENTLLQRLPEDSTILRTGPTTYDKTIAWLSGLPKGRWFAWVYANTMARLASPDVRAGWEKQVIGLCTRLPAHLKPDVIITQSGSYTAHIAGRYLAQQFSVPWIADLGDPLSLVDPDSWTYVIRAKRNRQLELHTIPDASGVVFTTEETLAAYRTWIGARLPQAIVLPCYGYCAADFPVADLKTRQADSRIALSHIGTAHRGNRNLIPTIQSLNALEQTGTLSRDFTLNIIGTHSQAFEAEAQRLGLRSAHFSGRVSYRESVDWINRSNILLIMGNAGSLQIPGKVYPYLGSGRPILYIGQLPQEQDPAARLLAQFPGVLFAQNALDSIEFAIKQIDSHYEKLCQEAVQRLSMPALHRYESSVVSDQFAEFVKKIAANSVTVN